MTTPAASGISASSGRIALLAGVIANVLARAWWPGGLRPSPAPRRVTLPTATVATQASATQASVAVDDDDDEDIADGLDDLMDRDDGDHDDDDRDDDDDVI